MNPLNPPGDIEFIYYNDNQLQRIPTNCLQCPVSRLILTGNKITNISDFAFANMSCLIQVELTKINRNTLKGLVGVYYMNLENNNINFIEEQSFYDLGRLLTLRINQNDLSTLSIDIFHPSLRPGDLTHFGISQNPFQCDTAICWALQPPHVTVLGQRSNMICDGPAHLNGQEVSARLIGCPSDSKWLLISNIRFFNLQLQ